MGVLYEVLGELVRCLRGTPGVLSAVLEANSVDTQGGTHGTPAVLGCTLEYSGAHMHARARSRLLSLGNERRTSPPAHIRALTHARTRFGPSIGAALPPS
jgi:hypothetical protein